MKNKIIGTKTITIAIAMFMMLGFVASIGVMAVGVESGIILIERETIYIGDDSEFTTINGVSNGTGTQSDPYIIENWEINGTSEAFCIVLEETDAYCIIKNCELYGAREDSYSSGIILWDSNNVTVKDCTIYDNDAGIWLDNSYNMIVQNCDLYDNGIPSGGGGGNGGISTGIKIHQSSDVLILSNSITDEVRVSIELSSSENCIVDNNYINNGDSHGIKLLRSSYNIIRNNYVGNCLNGLVGLGNTIGDVEYNEVYNNTFINNTEYGICLYETEYNTFYYNNLIDNQQNVLESNSVSFNGGVYNNIWYSNNNIGNYYDDYTGIDTNNDGIGEEEYIIYGNGSIEANVDLYPLTEPYLAESTYMLWDEIIIAILIAILPFIIILLIFKEIQKSFNKEVKK